MSAKAITSLNAPATQASTQRGAGLAGSTAVTTTVAQPGSGIVDQASTTQVVRGGLGTTLPATAAGFDRTVVTTLGK